MLGWDHDQRVGGELVVKPEWEFGIDRGSVAARCSLGYWLYFDLLADRISLVIGLRAQHGFGDGCNTF
jgi:hypothetical protein